jgi:hypothetical protein
MKTKCYLKIGSNGSVSVSKGKPNLDFDQVAVALDIELPDMLFKKPHITASIKVDEHNATPFTIDAETEDNVRNAIETATGLVVKLSIENPEESNV